MDRREFIAAAALAPILPTLSDTGKTEETGKIAQSPISFSSLSFIELTIHPIELSYFNGDYRNIRPIQLTLTIQYKNKLYKFYNFSCKWKYKDIKDKAQAYINLLWKHNKYLTQKLDRYHADLMNCFDTGYGPFFVNSLKLFDIYWTHSDYQELNGENS